MRLHSFILQHQERILVEWDAFATSLIGAASQMSRAAIRDHAKEILEAIAADLAEEQTAEEQRCKSIAPVATVTAAPRTAAQTHAVLRAQSGFDINQLIAEFRALRASVLRLWAAEAAPSAVDLQDTIRFNEAVDTSLAESVSHFHAELERSRNLLLGMLGHDMRNPLGVVLLTAEYLNGLNAGVVVSQAATRLIASGARLQALLDDLVDFNRANLGVGLQVARRSCDPLQVFTEQVELLRTAHPGRQVSFEPSGDLHGRWDADRMHQLLGNLVTNALKHGDRTRPVRIAACGGDADVRLEVMNEGPPIPPELLPHIFKPLRQGQVQPDASTTNDSLGLGLFIVSEIVEAHGGKIKVTSDEAGTAFEIRLPIVPA